MQLKSMMIAALVGAPLAFVGGPESAPPEPETAQQEEMQRRRKRRHRRGHRRHGHRFMTGFLVTRDGYRLAMLRPGRPHRGASEEPLAFLIEKKKKKHGPLLRLGPDLFRLVNVKHEPASEEVEEEIEGGKGKRKLLGTVEADLVRVKRRDDGTLEDDPEVDPEKKAGRLKAKAWMHRVGKKKGKGFGVLVLDGHVAGKGRKGRLLLKKPHRKRRRGRSGGHLSWHWNPGWAGRL